MAEPTPYQFAIKLLTRREHSRAELQQKLTMKFRLHAAELNEVLDQLLEEGWQSDARFAEVYLRSRSHQGYGWQRIRMELQQRGVEDGIAKEAYEQSEIDWNALKVRVEQKKFGDAPAADWTEQQKRLQYLHRRGL